MIPWKLRCPATTLYMTCKTEVATGHHYEITVYHIKKKTKKIEN